MKKTISIILSAVSVASAVLLSSCAAEKAPEEKVTARVFTLKGPTGMGMAKLMTEDENGSSENDYEFTLASSPDDVKAEIIKGNYDIAAIPTNLAAVLQAKTEGKIKIAAVNTLGVLYILERGDSINSIADLNGRELYATGQSSTPEYILDYILDANGVDCNVTYFTDHSEIAAKMTAGDIDLGMLPVPNATTVLASADVRSALDLTEEWKNAAAIKGDSGELYQGCVIVNPDFIAAHPEAVETFLKEYKESVDFVNTSLDEASAMMEKYGIIPKAAVAKAAIPNANIVCITGDEMATGLNGFYKVLFDSNPASVGGAVPGEDIYYIKK